MGNCCEKTKPKTHKKNKLDIWHDENKYTVRNN